MSIVLVEAIEVESVEDEKSVPADEKSLETAVLGLNASTCCVCADALANWSEILGELVVLTPADATPEAAPPVAADAIPPEDTVFPVLPVD